MAKKIFIVLMLIVSQRATAQNYVPTLAGSDSVRWYYVQCFENCGTTLLTARPDANSMAPFAKVVAMYTAYPQGYTMLQDSAYAHMREDTAARKVYFRLSYQYTPIDTNEHVLYDYSMAVGDSIYFEYPLREPIGWFDDPVWYTLDSVTMKQTLAGQRRLFNLSEHTYDGNPPAQSIQWLEGVGLLYFGYGNALNCSFQNDIHVFKTDSLSEFITQVIDTAGTDTTCTLYSSGISGLKKLTDFHLYPNPAANQLSVSIAGSSAGSITLSVVNVFGQPVLYWKALTNSEPVDISMLPDGFYTAIVSSRGSRAARPFLKQTH